MSRKELCQLIALVDSTSAFSVAGGAAKGLAKKIKLISDKQVSGIAVQSAHLEVSTQSDDMLRHRLWYAIASGLCIPAVTPFSSHTYPGAR